MSEEYDLNFNPPADLISSDLYAAQEGSATADDGSAVDYVDNTPGIGWQDFIPAPENTFDLSNSDVEYSGMDAVQNNLSSAAKTISDWLGVKTDTNGRQTQSFASQIVLGAAQSILSSMNADKTRQANIEMESQRSSNRIKEATEKETRDRTAASAMPNLARAGRTVTRPAGLLSAVK